MLAGVLYSLVMLIPWSAVTCTSLSVLPSGGESEIFSPGFSIGMTSGFVGPPYSTTMLVRAFVPVFLIATCVSVPMSSFTIIGSTDMLYFSEMGITGKKITMKNTMTRAKHPPITIERMDFFNC